MPWGVSDVNLLVWGPSEPSNENFGRWCQGFQFSEYEKTALLQRTSGPCAIIAAVQAGILRQILFTSARPIPVNSNLSNFELLTNALLEIFITVSAHPNQSNYAIFHWDASDTSVEPSEGLKIFKNLTTRNVTNRIEFSTLCLRAEIHCFLSLTSVDNTEDLHALILSLISDFGSEFGILCFLYSVLVTHGLDNVKNGMVGETETLIDSNFGNASQCLLNLLLTGQSSPYLFDGRRDLSGFCMQGITKQPKTGFLTIMESLRYCEVGWFLKNPSTPIWIIGSESHFTVLASPCLELVSVDQTASLLNSGQTSSTLASKASLLLAEREFENLCESSDAGFLTYEKFEELLRRLNLPNDNASIHLAKSTMDPDGMQIILRNSFFDYYYREEIKRRGDITSEFQVLHFNGLSVGQPRDKVTYSYGVAKIVDPLEECPPKSTALNRCLRTKWPTIQVTWEDGIEPAIE